MEYQEILNWLDDTTNQPFKFKTRNRVEITDKSRRTYKANSYIKFKTSMVKSNLCDYSDSYIHVKANITIPTTAADDATVNNTNKKVIIKNYALFTNCVSDMNK